MAEKNSHKNIFIYGGIVAVIMFGFCFALVPLYNMICKKTGINTSVQNTDLITPAKASEISRHTDLSREVKVEFVASNNMGMPWDFFPRTTSVRVHPGEQTKIYFHAKNTTEKPMTVQAIPSMTPADAISHFHKIECFCFRQQTLNGGESKEMALVFQVDRDLPKEMRVITLSYTLFDVTPKVVAKKDNNK